MNTKAKISMALICLSLLSGSCNQTEEHAGTDGTKNEIFSALPFSASEVKLLDGPFKQATELNKKVLLGYKPDRFLSKFRTEAGLKSKDIAYGGWENESIAGHSLGHYLSACALMYKSSGDTAFLNKINYVTDELLECQKAHGNGYIGAVAGLKNIFENKIAKGKIVSSGFDIYSIWAPFYTMHKEMAGLIDAYKLCENEKALLVARSFADWIAFVLKDLNEEQMRDLLKCEFGGINESLAELYAITGEQKYLLLAERFYDKDIYIPLLNDSDNLAGKHGNTQLAKIVGQARIYELTNDTSNKKLTTFFWNRVANHHSYITGGNCDHEHFGPADSLNNYLSEGTTETCNVYNMLKLSDHLFSWNTSVKYADFYERALYNHILSSQNPVDGRVIYNLSLKMGGHKVYQEPDWFTCCVGTGMENHSKYNSSIYFHTGNTLFVNQFIASELNWQPKGVLIKQTTQYPSEQGSTFNFSCKNPVLLTINVRYPSWAQKGIEIKVNGKLKRANQKSGSYIPITREWKTGDQLDIKMPFSLRTEAMPDNPNRVGIMYGPLVLAGVLGQIESSMYRDALYVPVLLLKGKNLTDCVVPVSGEANTFITTGIGRPRDIKLKPFYSTHDIRYSVYWDVFDEKEWDMAKNDYEKDREMNNRVEEMTIDFLQPGEMQAERDHQFSEKNSWVGELKNRKFRETKDGWFSFKMGVYQGQPIALVIDYRGGTTGLKTFDIFVNDKVIATEDQTLLKEEIFKSIQYEIPDNLTFDKSSVTIKLVPHAGHSTGSIFGIRTIRR